MDRPPTPRLWQAGRWAADGLVRQPTVGCLSCPILRWRRHGRCVELAVLVPQPRSLLVPAVP